MKTEYKLGDVVLLRSHCNTAATVVEFPFNDTGMIFLVKTLEPVVYDDYVLPAGSIVKTNVFACELEDEVLAALEEGEYAAHSYTPQFPWEQ